MLGERSVCSWAKEGAALGLSGPGTGSRGMARAACHGTTWHSFDAMLATGATNWKYTYAIQLGNASISQRDGKCPELILQCSRGRLLRELLRVRPKVATFLASVPPFPY